MAEASDILLEIAEKTRQRIEKQKEIRTLEEVRSQAEKIRAEELSGKAKAPADRTFLEALKTSGISYICEVKKTSPSKGVIAEDFPYLEIAEGYEAAGASAISCLTEPFYFKGSDRYLAEIASAVDIPVLRKDFTIDEYMIYEAKTLGASAVLLICSLLDDEQLREYIDIATVPWAGCSGGSP